MALEAQDNPFPYITLVDTADPVSPPAGSKYVWVDTDDVLKIKDESGTVSAVGGAAGAMATDALWDAAGDLAQGTGANTGAKLSAGTAGQFLKSGGAATANSWASRELDYVQFTSPITVSATTEAGANTCVTGSSVAYDGSTIVIVEFFASFANAGTAVSRNCRPASVSAMLRVVRWKRRRQHPRGTHRQLRGSK